MGGLLLDTLGSWAPGIVSALLVAALIPYVWRQIADQPMPVFTMPEQQRASSGD